MLYFLYVYIIVFFLLEVDMTQELIQNLVDVMDSAHSHRAELTELLSPLQEAKDQVCIYVLEYRPIRTLLSTCNT